MALSKIDPYKHHKDQWSNPKGIFISKDFLETSNGLHLGLWPHHLRLHFVFYNIFTTSSKTINYNKINDTQAVFKITSKINDTQAVFEITNPKIKHPFIHPLVSKAMLCTNMLEHINILQTYMLHNKTFYYFPFSYKSDEKPNRGPGATPPKGKRFYQSPFYEMLHRKHSLTLRQ